jgi:hypothetical protein
MNRFLKPASATLVAVILAASVGVPASAQLDAALNTGAQATRSAADAQTRINQLDDERSDMVREFRTLLQRKDAAALFVLQQERVVSSQREELASLEEQLGRVDEISREMIPMMVQMVEELEAFVMADLPFQREERLARIERVKAVMARPDVSEAERYRQIVEAYQAEMEYGRTIDSYELAVVKPDGATREVDVFRYGRVSLVYLSKDRSEAAMWDRAAGEWKPLPGSYRASILKGIRMAKKVATPDILTAPVSKFAVQ